MIVPAPRALTGAGGIHPNERKAMTKVYQSDEQRAIKQAEKVLQSRPWGNGPHELSRAHLHQALASLGVPMFWVELNGDEEAGPWLSKRAAEDYIDQHILDRGVCDDAYDRVLQEYAITDADGDLVE